MADNGEDKLLAVARHIAKTLGRTETMTDDILQIFSTFDGRFSREKMSEKSDEEDPRSFLALEHTMKSLHRRISHYVSADQPIWSDSTDSSNFLDSVDELLTTIRDWDPMAREKQIASCLDRADDLLQQAMFRLEDEFRLLNERGGESFATDLNRFGKSEFDSDSEDGDGDGDEDLIPIAHPITDYDVVIDALPPGTIADLHEIAKRMVAAGFGKECAHVYSICRREFLEESLSRLGLQELSIEEVQKMPWTEVEDEIEKWMKGTKVALRILFPSERRLCDRIFFGLSSAADLSFMEVCKPVPDTQVPTETGTPNILNIIPIDLILRFLLFITTFVAVIVMVTSKQTVFLGLLVGSRPAKFQYSPAFIYFVAALSLACLYSIFSFLVSLWASHRPHCLNKILFHFIFLDVIMLGFVASATGAAGAVGYLGLKGNSHVLWFKVCFVYDKFCRHVGSSAAISLFSSFILILLVVLSAHSLYRKTSSLLSLTCIRSLVIRKPDNSRVS